MNGQESNRRLARPHRVLRHALVAALVLGAQFREEQAAVLLEADAASEAKSRLAVAKEA